MRNNGDIDRVIEVVNLKLDNYVHNEETKYLSKIESLENEKHLHKQDYDEMANEYEGFVSQLIKEKKKLLEGSRHIILLFKDINNILFRMKNNKFSTNDLRVLSGFTLYRLNKEKNN